MNISPNLEAFLRLIREGETAQDVEAYRWLFGSTRRAPKLFDSFADHPRVRTYETYDGQFIRNGRIDYTTAAGAYQITESTWDGLVKRHGFLDFSPANQDAAAIGLINEKHALPDIEAGRIKQAIAKLTKVWASLPGASEGDQPTQSMERALKVYAKFGGTLDGANTPPPTKRPIAPEVTQRLESDSTSIRETYTTAGEFVGESLAPVAQEKPMAPFIAAALPSLIDLIPKLGALFGSGSAVSDRNVKAVEVVVAAAKEAISAKNEQDLVEQIKSDPAAAATVKQAVEAKWLEITEAGGGGIKAARDADVAIMGGDGPWYAFLRSPSFWVAVMMLPLVYLIVLNVVGVMGKPLSDEVRSAISNGVVGLILGGLIGYYYGQTTSRNRPPAA